MSTAPASFGPRVSSAALAVRQRGRAIVEHPVIQNMPVLAVIDPHEPASPHELLCKHVSVQPTVQPKLQILNKQATHGIAV